MSEQRSEIALARVDQAGQLLARVQNVAEAKTIIDQAEAIRAYTKRAHRGLVIQNRAATIRLRAERRAGELLSEVKRSKGGRPQKTDLSRESVYKRALKSADIVPSVAYKWQQVAAIANPKFEAYLQTAKGGAELSTSGLLAFGIGKKMSKIAQLGMNKIYNIAVGSGGRATCPHCHVRLKVVSAK